MIIMLFNIGYWNLRCQGHVHASSVLNENEVNIKVLFTFQLKMFA